MSGVLRKRSAAGQPPPCRRNDRVVGYKRSGGGGGGARGQVRAYAASDHDQQPSDGEGGAQDGSDANWFIDRVGDTGSCSSGPPPAMHRQEGGTGGQPSSSQPAGGMQGHGGGALYGDGRRAYSYYDGEAGSSSSRSSYVPHGQGGGSRHGGGQHGGGMSGGHQSERSFDARPRQYSNMPRSSGSETSRWNRGGDQGNYHGGGRFEGAMQGGWGGGRGRGYSRRTPSREAVVSRQVSYSAAEHYVM